MKVLNVFDDLDSETGGGGAERVKKISEYLAKLDHEVCVLSLKKNLSDFKIEVHSGVRFIYAPCFAVHSKFPKVKVPRVSFSFLRSLVKSTDVVHLHGHWSILNVVMFFALILERKNYLFSPLGCLTIFGSSGPYKSLYNFVIGRKLVKNASIKIAVTAREAEVFSDYGVKPSEVKLVPNGVDFEVFEGDKTKEFCRSFSLKSNKIILFMGRLNRIKGVDILLEAFAMIASSYPMHVLVIAGPDEGLREELELFVNANDLSERVFFSGFLSGQDKLMAYSVAQLLVVPSRQEAMSIVALEAGALKTPVLISNKSGFDEVDDCSGGVLVEANAKAIADKLVSLLADEKKLKKMGENLFLYVKSNYSWARGAKEIEILSNNFRTHSKHGD